MSVPPNGAGVQTPAPPERPPDGLISAPTWLSVVPENIPPDMTALRAWYPALIRPKKNKVGKWDKIPADPTTAAPATWSDPSTRCTFDVVYMAYQRDPRFAGVGFMMHTESGLIGVDLDKPRQSLGALAQSR